MDVVAPSLKRSSTEDPYPMLWISRQQFNRLEAYPLELRLFAKVYERIRLFELALSVYESDRRTQIKTEMGEFVRGHPEERRQRLHMALNGEKQILGRHDDRRYVYCRNDGTLAFVSRIAEYSARETLKVILGGGEKPRDKLLKGYWYERKVLQLFAERDVLQFQIGKEPDRKVRQWSGRVEELLSKEDMSTKLLYLAPPTHQSQRAFDFTLVFQVDPQTHGQRSTYVFFVQVCSGSHHKDSFRDLVRRGDALWLQHLDPQRHRLGYIWVTPDRAGVLTLKTNEGENFYSFREPEPDCPWNALIAGGPDSYRHLIGRTARKVAQPYPEKSPFKKFLDGFDELMIVVPMSEFDRMEL
jgi:hypothetical protein